MTEDEREKFDAIRMNLELTGHDLESMRERVDKLVVACEENRIACERNRIASEAQWKSIEAHKHEFESVREDIRTIAKSTAELVRTAEAHERRIEKLEARN